MSYNFIKRNPEGEILVDIIYEHDQSTASNTWNVNHNLGERICHVIVVDNNYKKIIPDHITFTDSNNLTIEFDDLTITGKAKISI